MMLLSQLFFLLWFFLPAGIANMLPVFAAKLPGLRHWSYPLDGYKSVAGQRILGDHKTIRGLVCGVMVAIIVTFVQFVLVRHIPELKNILPPDYQALNPWLLGFCWASGR